MLCTLLGTSPVRPTILLVIEIKIKNMGTSSLVGHVWVLSPSISLN